MRLSDVAAYIGGSLSGEDCEFEAVNTDTRKIKQGDVFVALKGENFDANDYLKEAEEKGALAIVTERNNPQLSVPIVTVTDTTAALGLIAKYKRQQLKAQVAAITGSCGKTTVKGMLKNICEIAGRTAATSGNFNNHIGVPLTLLAIPEETQFAVVEAGTSGVGEIEYLADIIQPEVALVNNVRAAHVEGFGSVEAIAKEKAEIYGRSDSESTVVINLDDQFAEQYLKQFENRDKIVFCADQGKRFELSRGKCIEASNIQLDQLGRPSFQMSIDGSVKSVQMKVLGQHNVSNALAAASCAVGMGIAAEIIVEGLEKFHGEKGRLQIHDGPKGSVVVDDTYNSNPGSMVEAINWLANFSESILVSGDMAELGEDADLFHKEIGVHAKEKGIKSLYAVGKHASAMAQGFGNEEHVYASQEELINALKNEIANNSVVLVKGSRSAKMEKVVNAVLMYGVPSKC